jgi:hypothetical protein
MEENAMLSNRQMGNYPIQTIIILVLAVSLYGCGGGGGGGSEGQNDPIDDTTVDVTASGVVVFEQASVTVGNKSSTGIMEYHIEEDRLVFWHAGEMPRRHPNGEKTVNRFFVTDTTLKKR